MSNDDRRWMDDKFLEVFDYFKDDRANIVHEWYKLKSPILTPRAKAILEVVEEAMDRCLECKPGKKSMCKIGLQIDFDCPLAPIRKVWKEIDK